MFKSLNLQKWNLSKKVFPNKCEEEAKMAFGYSLDKKINEFVKWYTKEFVDGKYTKTGEYAIPKEIKNTIEKMAVWYELRFNDNDVNNLYPGSSIGGMGSNQAYLQDNQAILNIRELLDEEEKIRFSSILELINWKDLYGVRSFINSLNCYERNILTRPKYVYSVRLKIPNGTLCLYLTVKGKIRKTEIIHPSDKFNQNFNNWHISDVVKHLKEHAELSPKNELESAIRDYENRLLLKEKFLDAVMYRIIERGGNRIGPRRAFMFAKEFERNIDIPMIYGVDLSDPGLRNYTLEYIKAGGSYKLECLIGYFSITKDNEPLKLISVGEIINTVFDNCVYKYTREETELYQRLVDIISNLNSTKK